MSQLQQALTNQVIAAATTSELLEAAQTLLRAAFDNARHDANGTPGDGTCLSDGELLDQVLATQQVQNSAWATQTLRLDQLAQREYDKHPESPDTWTPLEVGARLGWTDRQTSLRLTQAVDSVRHTPLLLHQAGTGELEGRKVIAVSDALADTVSTLESADGPHTPGLAAKITDAIQAEILASAPETSTSTKLRRRTGRLLTQHAPVAADHAAAARRRESTDVTVAPQWEPGMSTLTAVLPALDAAQLITAINTHAKTLHETTTTTKTLGECRVDALTDLVLSDVRVTAELVLHVPFHPATAASTNTSPEAGTGGTEAHGRHRATGTSDATGTGVGGGVGVLDRPSIIDDTAATDATPGAVGAWTSKARPPGPPEFILPINSVVLDLDTCRPTSCRPISGAERQLKAKVLEAALRTGTRPPPDRIRSQQSTPSETPAPTANPARYRLGDVHVPGVGVIPADAIRELTRLLGTKITRALVNADTGTVAETANQTYTPGTRLARFVRARDQHCRFPGCTRPATLTDLDHVTPYPDGPTAAHNLQCLCRHHHRAKHETGWTVSMTPDGACTWTSPTGHVYTTHPAD
ncbi:HNH endonuclease signature motif containing protein [Flexivirga meconopsidis]|uniref:HNH endonuclease signature motif containing protein n=1 Tax=Flexivirga meconopsidis TaxID=2977121 RepID=UPI002240031D|nr:HNH endonuclease signature motif containing protein [Flexivirga meconopsidis]